MIQIGKISETKFIGLMLALAAVVIAVIIVVMNEAFTK
jgi:hypothetical protein